MKYKTDMVPNWYRYPRTHREAFGNNYEPSIVTPFDTRQKIKRLILGALSVVAITWVCFTYSLHTL